MAEVRGPTNHNKRCKDTIARNHYLGRELITEILLSTRTQHTEKDEKEDGCHQYNQNLKQQLTPSSMLHFLQTITLLFGNVP